MKNFIVPFAEWVFSCENLEIDNKIIVEHLKNLDFINVEGFFNRPFITKDKNILNNLPNVKNYFEKIIHNSIKEIGYNVDIKIGTSWGTLCRGNLLSEFHNHSNYWLSAVYYPHGSENKIQFRKPIPSNWQINTEIQNPNYTSFTSTDYTKINNQGTLIVFPSYLQHRIINQSEERYSIAMNINPIGEIGTDDSKIKM